MRFPLLITRSPFPLGAVVVVPALLCGRPAQSAPGCDPGNGGLVLADGFCASVVARDLDGVRELAVAPGGVLYAALRGGGGGVAAFRDRDDDGKPDERARFGSGGGNDVEVRNGYLYFAREDAILRWRLTEGKLAPEGKSEVVASDLPADGGHTAKSIAFKGDTMFVNVGSRTNSCQRANRRDRSPGIDPCVELERRAGIWAFSANRVGQQFSQGKRYATGLRNAMALAVQPGGGTLYAAVHGRDQLAQNWGFSDSVSAENPAEELVAVHQGDDFGWPYCYYSTQVKRKVLAPEYGGDGRSAGRCERIEDPVIAFPGHWAPLALAFYGGDAFGPTYRDGLFVAFHGSWNRAPLPQAGYRVVFVPFAEGRPGGSYETFATGAEGPTSLRASGLAVGRDGALFISDEASGTIWRVTRR